MRGEGEDPLAREGPVEPDEDQDEEQLASSDEPKDQAAELRGKLHEARERGRIEILKGQTFVTREPNYESSVFSKWEHINQKFHLLGWRHLKSWRAYLEMFSELQAFLYELAGNVDRAARDQELAYLEGELAWIRTRPQRIRIPLLYNLASNLFHNTRLGLKQPTEKSVFDLDVDQVFARHEQRTKDARKVEEIVQP